MKKILPLGLLVGLLVIGLAYVLSLSGPNEYAARIAEAQADLETARALQDQARALDTMARGMNRVSWMQALTLFVIVLGVIGLVAVFVAWRMQGSPVPPARPVRMVSGPAPIAGLPEGVQGMDPALVNQMITIEILKALRGMNAPQLPADVRRDGHEGR